VCQGKRGAGDGREADMIGAFLLPKAVARHHAQPRLLQERQRVECVGFLLIYAQNVSVLDDR
jgi:hypothetical protein